MGTQFVILVRKESTCFTGKSASIFANCAGKSHICVVVVVHGYKACSAKQEPLLKWGVINLFKKRFRERLSVTKATRQGFLCRLLMSSWDVFLQHFCIHV